MTTIDEKTGTVYSRGALADDAAFQEPGWFNDPSGLHQLRYFNGVSWTEHVTHSGPTPCEHCSHY